MSSRDGSPGARRALSLLALAVALAVAPGAWRWVTQDARDWEPNEAAPGEEGPSISARGVQRFEARDEKGQQSWEFSARRIDLSADKKWATLEAVERAVLFREGKPFLEMSASSVRFDQGSHDWQAQGDLRVSGADGLLIRSQSATWSDKDQRLNCAEDVTAQFKGANLRTVGISYDAKIGELQSLSPVTLIAPSLSARGARVVADVKGRVVKFPEGLGDLTVQPPLLKKYGLTR